MQPRGSSWILLSVPIAVLGTIASICGIAFESVYERDTEHFATQAVSQDWVTLIVAVPGLLVLGWLAYRGSFTARLMWHGAAFYFAYTYAIAAFMVRFNALFLVYTSLLACSIFAVGGGLISLGWPIAVETFRPAWPRRGTIIFLWFVVGAFTFLWLSDIAPALFGGSLPDSLTESETPTNGVQVLDLAVLLPVAGLSAIWLARRESRGYVMAMALATYVCLLGTALAAMIVGLAAADLSTDVAVAGAFVAVTVAAAVLLTLMARATSDARVHNRERHEPTGSRP